MSYYRGDYYRGDYYRGDPFLGALAGAAARKFGPKILGAIRGATRRVAPRTMERFTDIGTAVGIGQALQGGRNQPISLTPIGELSPTMPGSGAKEPGTSIVRVKKPYFGPKGPRRRMNPLNPRALRRALRRAEGFEKFAARTVNALYKTVDGRRTRTFKKKGK